MKNTKYTKISNSASEHFILDSYFYYLIMMCNGELYNLRGAMLDERWEVAYVSMKIFLSFAVQMFTFMNGYKIQNESDRYLIYSRLKGTIKDNDLYNEIMEVEKVQLFDEKEVEINSRRVIEIVFEELALRKYLEFSVIGNYVDFPILLKTFVKIDEIEEIIDRHKARYKYPKEMNEQFMKLSDLVKNE